VTLDIRPLGLEGVLEILPKKFVDERGFLSESHNVATFRAAGIDIGFVQDNHSYSAAKGVLRGLHYQLPPVAQDKLVRVVRGAIFDVVVDIRRSSATFGKWIGIEISARAWNQVLVPRGFAHGFVTLEPDTEVIYKVSDFYAPKFERAIRYDDPKVGIAWPVSPDMIVMSDKDRTAPALADAELLD
jgi:dTDP-4-dehydrorhamnose 3,5-epimerase